MHRSVQNPPPTPRPSHCFPARLTGCRRPRCETKSARAAEQQAAVQMPGSCSCLLNIAQGLAIVRWTLPILCGWSPSSSMAWKCKVQPLNSLAMETSPCCCVFTMTQKRPFCIHYPSYPALVKLETSPLNNQAVNYNHKYKFYLRHL